MSWWVQQGYPTTESLQQALNDKDGSLSRQIWEPDVRGPRFEAVPRHSVLGRDAAQLSVQRLP